MDAKKFMDNHYAWFHRFYSEYPEDLWPLFAEAVLHYQRVEPDSNLFLDMIEEDVDLGDFVRKEISKKVVNLEQRVRDLEKCLSHESFVLSERATELTQKDRRIEELEERLKVLEGLQTTQHAQKQQELVEGLRQNVEKL